MPQREKNPFLVSGIVATIHVVVDSQGIREEQLYGMARELQQKIRHDFEEQVRISLGSDFQIAHFEIRPGSIHILAHIATDFAIYVGIARYKSFVDSVNLLTNQIRRLTEMIFKNTPVGTAGLNVRASWTPGPSVATANAALREPHTPDYNTFMVLYMIASNAAMLTVLIWLLIRHMK